MFRVIGTSPQAFATAEGLAAVDSPGAAALALGPVAALGDGVALGLHAPIARPTPAINARVLFQPPDMLIVLLLRRPETRARRSIPAATAARRAWYVSAPSHVSAPPPARFDDAPRRGCGVVPDGQRPRPKESGSERFVRLGSRGAIRVISSSPASMTCARTAASRSSRSRSFTAAAIGSCLAIRVGASADEIWLVRTIRRDRTCR